jgi:FkbM family methyltransferase
MPKNIFDNPRFIESGLRDYFDANPLSFLDIGARGGVHDIVEPISKITSVIGFEPNIAECQRLMQNPLVINPWHTFSLEQVALFSDERQSNFFEVIEPNNSSIYEPNPVLTNRYGMGKWAVKGKSKIAVTTLDNVHKSKYGESQYSGEFIKIDTQGSEYDILKGAECLLKQTTVCVMVEVSFCELYKNQKLFSEVEIFLRNCGFSFYGFTAQHFRSCKLIDKRVHSTRERLIYGDAIFFKDPFDSNSSAVNERSLKVLFILLLIFGHYDFAIELVEKQEILGFNIINMNHAKDIVHTLAFIDQGAIMSKIEALCSDAGKDQISLVPLVARFVSEIAFQANHDDLLNKSPLPKTH